MEAEGVDWENLRAKYEKIMKTVHENYPKTGDIEEFPHGECIQELHKARITNKIKKIRSDDKKAVDLAKQEEWWRKDNNELLWPYPLDLSALSDTVIWQRYLRLIERVNAADNEFREPMGKMTNTTELVGYLISQSLALMTAMMLSKRK